MPEESTIDLDEHARLIAQDIRRCQLRPHNGLVHDLTSQVRERLLVRQ